MDIMRWPVAVFTFLTGAGVLACGDDESNPGGVTPPTQSGGMGGLGGGGAGGMGGAGGVGGGGTGGAAGQGGAGGQGGMGDPCPALAEVIIDESFLAAGDDDIWEVGETATVGVSLLSPLDDRFSPGIRVTHGGGVAAPASRESYLPGLMASVPELIGVEFDAIATGPVTFTIDVADMAGACPDFDSVQLVANVE
jgi:hypothetical protein